MYSPIAHHTNSCPIYNFTILGERHSGTNWLEKLIGIKCRLPITWEYGFKHWINLENLSLYQNSSNTLFICITRNIYDWIYSFYKEPHHIRLPLTKNLDNFMSLGWESDKKELNFVSNQSYKNIFELRKSKLEYYYHYMPFLVDNLLIIKYEDLRKDPLEVLNFIVSNYKNINMSDGLPHNIAIKKLHYLKLKYSEQQIGFINDHAYWKYENLYDYRPCEFEKINAGWRV
jgi:hypothetical protein